MLLGVIDWEVKTGLLLLQNCATFALEFNTTSSFHPSLQLAAWQMWDLKAEIWPVQNVLTCDGCQNVGVWRDQSASSRIEVSCQRRRPLQCWSELDRSAPCPFLNSMSSCYVNVPIFFTADWSDIGSHLSLFFFLVKNKDKSPDLQKNSFFIPLFSASCETRSVFPSACFKVE